MKGIDAWTQKNHAGENFLVLPRKKPNGIFTKRAMAETKKYGNAER